MISIIGGLIKDKIYTGHIDEIKMTMMTYDDDELYY